MAAVPQPRAPEEPQTRLAPFDASHADRVLRWVATPREMYWLAPNTRPPLTARDITGWRKPGHQPFLLLDATNGTPVGYGELNELTGVPGNYWLGHLLVDPEQRGRGFGIALTRRLLERAFVHAGATRVTLVVFPENAAAVRCYERAGMRRDGYEAHHFEIYNRREQLLRMAADYTTLSRIARAST